MILCVLKVQFEESNTEFGYDIFGVITKPKVIDIIVKASSEITFDGDELKYSENEKRIVSFSQNDKSLTIND
jgi:hypothetical protein